MPKLCICVRTPPILREFLISRNGGSDIIKVDYNDVFARKIIPYLEVAPENANVPTKRKDDCIKIEISYNENNIIKVNYNGIIAQDIIEILESEQMIPIMKQKGPSDDIKIEINYFEDGNTGRSIESRNYLSEESQGKIVYEWNNTFKEIFHNYMIAFCKGMKYKIPCQKLAMISFCEDYNISMENISLDTLKKSWDRSDQKLENIESFTRASGRKYYKNKLGVLSPSIKNKSKLVWKRI